MEKENIDVLVLLIAGTAALVLGIYKHRQRSRLVTWGIKVKGTVLSMDHSVASRTTASYHPVVSYTTLQNETITGTYDIGEEKLTYFVGEHIDIIYDITNNHEFIIDDKQTKRVGPMFIIGGLAFIVIAAVQYFLHPFGAA